MNIDQNILLWINQGMASPGADFLFTWVSLRLSFALPLLLGLLWLLTRHHGRDGAKLWLLLILVILLSDALGNLIKIWASQHRPCSNFYQALRFIPGMSARCDSNVNGMPSNHALTYFATVSFLALTTHRRGVVILLAVVALLVCISRIYLSKHYPSQVLAGALLGIAWGSISGWLGLHYLRFVQRVHREQDADG